MSFVCYIQNRRAGANPVGDFVRDARSDSRRPEVKSWSELRLYLVRCGACRVSVPLSVMERLPKMSKGQYEALLALNHKRVCDEEGARREPAVEMPEGSNVFQLGEHKVI